MSGVTYYQSGKIKRLRTLPQIVEGETKAAIRRGQNRLRRALFEEFRSRGLGRSIFAKEGMSTGRALKGIKTVIAREKVQKRGELYEVGIVIKGMAALVAKGGRTTAHAIKPSKYAGDSVGTIRAGSGILANKAAGFFARGSVNHPGSQMKRDDFPGRAIQKTSGEFKAEVGKIPARIAEIVDRG